ncbi:hypothetical protein GW819_03775 [Candidatus Gracilibacteria bacterium]|nr:hypothetical protein [Candidatus Gracilibacteria bacterium]OIO77267.1 MAG: hypothetical protein AUJ87_01625 [Candidatus Gracilibacteria bacterium CG1_02_38_174]PIQ10657.1 MAG: hypothetical protein COW68_04135 [Candidatus Gracilibacteria bacterium CG18_big_fil_WC_8_21_14_2_50_38_16]PIQ41839.1 MAG: hypothetical protein COW06_01690 [Candidatus Gracilibacteria bacterium CG12_big_fil_rev_8_21_14_0_65_38_15]PIZ01865.1 MAG: hypothetical protein COY60_01360 [Candidatus Gracilibacteria bacterium CG_4
MFIIKIFYALFGIVIGLGILKYRKVVYSWTGRFYWAEKYLGSGGTVFVITLVGLGFIFVSAAYPFGVFDTPRQFGDTTNTEITQSQTPIE